jgi:hypothetical protein
VDTKSAEKQRFTDLLVERHNRQLHEQELIAMQREQLRREESKQALLSTLEVQIKMKKDA